MIKEIKELKKLRKDLQKHQNKKKAKILARFFKTGIGEYGQGDIFLGITVPISRIIAKKYRDLSLNFINRLIKSKIHEERLVAVLILIEKYKIAQIKEKREIYKFYLKNTKNINNWDLVDLSAPKILGAYLLQREKEMLFKLAKSKNLWQKRIAIIATFQFIYFGQTKWTYKIVKILLKDEQDLVQKACGWMLREAGKRVSEKELENFLKHYAPQMPRTMLRYAIERLPEIKRKYFLKIK